MNMNKKLKVLVSVIAMSFVMVGCGGSGTNSGGGTSGGSSVPIDSMSQKDVISIIHHYPADTCRDPLLVSIWETKGYTNVETRVENNSVNCSTYNMIDGPTSTGSCGVDDMPAHENINTSCVIGLDYPKSSQISSLQNIEDATLEMSFMVDAME